MNRFHARFSVFLLILLVSFGSNAIVEEKRLPSLPKVDQDELPAKVLKYKKDFNENQVLENHVARELNVVEGKDDSPTSNLLHSIDRTKTWYGREALKFLLTNPLGRREEDQLRERQKFVKRLADSPELLEQFDRILIKVAEHQENVFLLWSLVNPFNNSTDLQAMFNQLTDAKGSKVWMETVRQTTNATAAALTASLVGATNYFGYNIIKKALGYKSLGKKNCYLPGEGDGVLEVQVLEKDQITTSDWLKFGLSTLATGFCFYKIVPAVKNAEKTNKDMQELMISIGETVNAATDIVKVLEKVDGADHVMKYTEQLRKYTTRTKELSVGLQKLLSELKASTFKGKPSYWSLMGRVRLAYQYTSEIKESLVPLLKAIGEVDAYVSPAKLVIEYKKNSVHYCFAEFVKSDGYPMIKVTKSWNPLIKSEDIITEDIALGTGDNLVPNILLTGPHGGGKSTFMRQIAMCVVLAQVFGIAPAESLTMTTFSKINTYLDIKDNPEKSISTFMAERARMQLLKTKIRGLQDGRFALTIIDEPFKATMEQEASKLVTKFMEKIEQVTENITIMASHFIEPAVASEKRDNSRFVNFHMDTIERTPGRFKRSFKLKPGKCGWWFDDEAKRSRYVNWLQTVIS